MEKLIFVIITISFIMTSCSPFESNYNSYEQKLVENQKNVMINHSDFQDNFFVHNEIRLDQSLAMNDMNYLVFYHRGGETEKEKGFEKILQAYIEDEDSFNVYLVDLDLWDTTIDLIRLVFISRDGNIYEVKDVWYDPKDIEMLPYRIGD